VLKAAPGGLPYPLFALVGVARAKIVQRSFAAAMIVFKEHSAEETGGSQVCLDIEKIQKQHEHPQGDVLQVVLDGIAFSLFLLSRMLGHSP